MKFIMIFHILTEGIPILDQYIESPFATTYPPNKEVPDTSPEEESQLDDVVGRIGILNLE